MTYDELAEKVARAIAETYGMEAPVPWQNFTYDACAAIAVVVEEAAKVAEDCIDDRCEVTKRVIGAAIRKLGETP